LANKPGAKANYERLSVLETALLDGRYPKLDAATGALACVEV
jgi:hypothetical protein